MGILTVGSELNEESEQPMGRPACERVVVGEASCVGDALQMHCKRAHGWRFFLARRFVLGSVSPTCNRDFVSRPRVLDHMMRGTLACTLPWRLGHIQPLPPDLVLAADLGDRAQRRAARPRGYLPGVGIPFRQPSVSPSRQSWWYFVRPSLRLRCCALRKVS